MGLDIVSYSVASEALEKANALITSDAHLFGDITITNGVLNGNGAGGTTGWSTTNGTLSISNGKVAATGNGTSSSTKITQSTTTPVTTGQKVYVRAKMKCTNGTPSYFSVQVYIAPSTYVAESTRCNNPVQGQEYVVSGIVTIGATAGNVQVRLTSAYADTTTQNGKTTETDDAMLIVISGTPLENMTKSEIDSIVDNYFNGFFEGTRSSGLRAIEQKMESLYLIGSGTFNSTTGVTITHNIGHANYKVSVTPTVNSDGWLGEIYVTKAANTCTVYCTGSTTTTTFDYVIVKY